MVLQGKWILLQNLKLAVDVKMEAQVAVLVMLPRMQINSYLSRRGHLINFSLLVLGIRLYMVKKLKDLFLTHLNTHHKLHQKCSNHLNDDYM